MGSVELCCFRSWVETDVKEHTAQVGSFVAHAGWVTALAWCADGERLFLATGCSEGSLRLYVAQQSTLAALPDLLHVPSSNVPAASAADQHPSATQQGSAEQASASDLDVTAEAPGGHAATDGERPGAGAHTVLPVMHLMSVVLRADLRGVTCIDLRASKDSSTGVHHYQLLLVSRPASNRVIQVFD